ncbi:pilus assembly PilX family protein [Dokdonella sp.]|uniref:pilus assembly PilX family protein n=1 Tax=Dokdonella sp. TaxID=2291710 RepID=UPI0031BEF11D|nr:pilus assembly protein [Dokdonella sp.]
MNRPVCIPPSRQRGAVLFVALIFLILITLLALTATGTSILQEKMTGGMRNSQLAMLGSQSGLRGEESRLWNVTFNVAQGQPFPPCVSNVTGSCLYRPLASGALLAAVQNFRTSRGWVPALAGMEPYAHTLTGLTGDSATASLAAQPITLVEDMGPDLPPGIGQQSGAIDPETQTANNFYRITARSQGGSAAVQRVTESVFSSANLTNTGTEP